MGVFKPRFRNLRTIGFQQLNIVAVSPEKAYKQLEMNRKHIRYKDCVVFFHFLGKRNKTSVLHTISFPPMHQAGCEDVFLQPQGW